MRLIWVDGNRLLRAGVGRTDVGAAIVGRVQPVAMMWRAGPEHGVAIGKEAAWGPAWITVRQTVACSLTITPVLDGEVLASLAQVHHFPFRATTTDTTVKFDLRRPLTATRAFASQALRGTRFTLRAELVANVINGGDDDVLAFGALELDVRALNWSRGST